MTKQVDELDGRMETSAKAVGKPTQASRAAVGEEIRALRRAQNLSVANLSQRAGVSAGMISQIERGLTNPSIRIMTAIGEALGVPLSNLLEAHCVMSPGPSKPSKPSKGTLEGPYVVRKVGERPSFFVGNAPLFKELLSPPGCSKLQMMTIALPPQSKSEDVVLAPGEKAGFVISGELTLAVAGNEYRLVAGDSFQFDATRQHAIYNRTDETVKVFWVIALEKPAPF